MNEGVWEGQLPECSGYVQHEVAVVGILLHELSQTLGGAAVDESLAARAAVRQVPQGSSQLEV